MQVVMPVRVRISGREATLTALFDTGSAFTLMGHVILKKRFGDVEIRALSRPRKAVLVNGQEITINAFIDAQLFIKDYMIEERIYLSPDIVEEAEVAGAKRRLPELLIGAPTMETWDIEIDIKKGDVVIRGVPFIL